MTPTDWIPIARQLPPARLGWVLVATTIKGRDDDESGLGSGSYDVANTIYVGHNARKGWYTHWAEIAPLPTI